MNARTQRNVALGGLLFIVLVLASLLTIGSLPDSDASSAKVVKYYHSHKGAVHVSTYLLILAIIVAIYVFWTLREFLATTPLARQLSTIGFIGVLLFIISGAIAAGSLYANVQEVNHADPSTIQTFHILQGNFTSGFGAAGIAAFLIATNIAVIKGTGRLPTWLGWVGIVLGIASIVLIDPGIIALGLWLLIACVTLLVRRSPTAASAVAEPELG